MKYFKFSLVVLIAVMFLGCSKDDNKTSGSNEKMNESTQNNQQSTPAFFKVSSVDAGSKGTVPNFTWDENGKKVSMNDFKGKVLFLNFYATWCGPCKKEIPDLKQITTELKDKEFKMFGINIFPQQGAQSLEDFLKTYQLNYTVLDGNEDLVKSISTAIGSNLEAVPTTLIVDKTGKIVETIIGSKSKEQFLQLINKYL